MTEKAISTAVNAPGPEAFDVFELSKRCLLVVVFSKTNSPYFKTALSVADGAEHFQKIVLGGAEAYAVGFGRTVEQAARADVLIGYIQQWNSVQFMAQGRLILGHWKVRALLNCYQVASSCTDPDAHCVVVNTDCFTRDPNEPRYSGFSIRIDLSGEPPAPPPPKKIRLTFPCRIAAESFLIDKAHPSSWADQVQAEAVRKNTDWCPLFDISKFRQYD